jgi:hypothetical protein
LIHFEHYSHLEQKEALVAGLVLMLLAVTIEVIAKISVSVAA